MAGISGLVCRNSRLLIAQAYSQKLAVSSNALSLVSRSSFHSSSALQYWAPWRTQRFTAQYEKDSVPEGLLLIYDNSFKNYIYPTFIATSMMLWPCFPLCWHLALQKQFPTNFTGHNEAMVGGFFVHVESISSLLGFMGFAALLYIAMTRIVNATVLRIYRHDHETYTYAGMDWKFKRYQVRFTPLDITSVPHSPITQGMMGNFAIRGKKVMVLPDDFLSIQYYNEVLSHVNTRAIEEE